MSSKVSGAVVLFILIVFVIAVIIHQRYNYKVHTKVELSNKHLVPPYIDLLFLFCGLLVAFVVEVFLMTYRISTPYGAFIVIVGYLWGILAFNDSVVKYASHFMYVEAGDLFYVYTPVVMFNTAFGLDASVFVKTLPQTLVIGIPVSLSTGLLFGAIAKFVVTVEWSLAVGLIFGVLCIPTFPKSILYLLKQQSSRTKHISVLLEGEAVITFIIADVVYKLLLGDQMGFIAKWYQTITLAVRFLVFGLLSGWLFGLAGRYLIRRMYNNKISICTVCFCIPFLTYAFSEIYISGCGSISVAVVGIMLAFERTFLTKTIENYLISFWEIGAFALDVVVCLTSATAVSCRVVYRRSFVDFSLLPVLYLLYYVFRFLCFLLYSPILSRIGYGMDLKNMVVLVWCGVKSTLSILQVVQFVQRKIDKDISLEFYFFILGLYFFSVIINGSFIECVLEFLGMNKISIASQINMTNCMKHIFRKREKTVAVLKMDRFLADTNWPLVIEATTMMHPYELQVTSDEDDDMFNRLTFCPDCKKDVELELTGKELKDMIKEARARVLKAKKMCYSRQYENGMISKEAISILNHAVELAMDSENLTIDVEDLHNKFKENHFRRYVRHRVEKIAKDKQRKFKPPRTYWRRLCYHLVVTNRTFDKIMLGVIVYHLVWIGVDMYYHPSLLYGGERPKIDPILNDFLLLTKIICTLLYAIEFIIKILAYSRVHICAHGFRTYFKNFWNISDFVAMIGCFLGLVITVMDTISNVEVQADAFAHDRFRQLVDALKIFRSFRLLRVFEIFYPDIINYLDRSTESEKAFTYELGKSYASGETEILNMLPYMIVNVKIREDVKERIEADRLLVTRLLGIVQKERPWIAITVKTKQAIRTILNSMMEAIKQLKSAGWIDTYEHGKLILGMGELFKKVNTIQKVQPSPPKVIFKEVAWMHDDEAVIDFLFENVTVKSFEPGQIVFAEGDVADGIYIVVTGLFMLTYTPNANILKSLYEYGQLPIVDYLSGMKYQEPFVDFIVSGNIIGELSTVTLRSYNCVITADAHSTVYVLSHGVLRRAMELSPDPFTGLEARIWKEVSIRIALPLLMAIPAYQTFSQDQIKYALERAFVPDLSKYKIFTVTNVIENIVLIEGLVADYNTRKLFVAPYCIPRTIQKLILPTSSLLNIPIKIDTKLLIIPEKGVDEYDVMIVAEETCEMLEALSSVKCLQHTIQDRLARKRLQQRAVALPRKRNLDEMSLGASGGTLHGASSSFSFKTSKTEYESIPAIENLDENDDSQSEVTSKPGSKA